MIYRLRSMLDQPLAPRAARTVVVLATAILIGFGVLFVLGASESGRPAVPSQSVVGHSQQERSLDALRVEAPPPGASRHHRQDPQDEEGSPAADRAAKAMRSHRALQHVPYRSGRLSVRLAGARGSRAVLVVSAPTISAALRGWRQFLRRYRDSGRSYVPGFRAAGGRDG